MRLSVIVPVYNVEKYLEECINSIINERIEKMEIIVINDGSTDNSLEILKKIKKTKRESNLKIIEQENSGISVARNKGIEAARGEYLYFIDSDDFLEKNGLKLLLEEIIVKNADIIRGNYVEYYSENRIIKQNKMKDTELKGREYLIKRQHTFVPMVWNCIYKRKFLLKNNLKFRIGILNEDVEFNFRAIYLAEKIVEKEVIMYNYRKREASIMSKDSLTETRKLEFLNSLYEVGTSLNKFLKKYNEKNKKIKKMVFRYYFNIFSLANRYNLELNKIDFLLKKLKVKELWSVAPTIKDKRNVFFMCWFPYYFYKRRYKKQ